MNELSHKKTASLECAASATGNMSDIDSILPKLHTQSNTPLLGSANFSHYRDFDFCSRPSLYLHGSLWEKVTTL